MTAFARRLTLIPRYNWDFGAADLARALRSLVVSGEAVERRGEEFERLFGRKPIFTASGRASLYTILKTLGLPPGAGVGIPLFCCPVVISTVLEAGFEPVFLDVGGSDYSLSAADVSRKRARLAAVIAVHMFGHPADIDAIVDAAAGIPVVEDCAQSLFSLYKGKLTGTLTEASFFSFRSGKYLSAGEGSVLFCGNGELGRRIESFVAPLGRASRLRDAVSCLATWAKSALYRRPLYGLLGYPVGTRLDRRFNITHKSGFELRGIARSHLHTISERIRTFRPRIERQRENALFLLDRIDLPRAVLPVDRPGCRSNYYQFALRFETEEERDRVVAHLWSEGIDCPKYLDGIVDEARSKGGYSGDCPLSERYSRTTAVIPNHYTLGEREMERIAQSIGRAGKAPRAGR